MFQYAADSSGQCDDHVPEKINISDSFPVIENDRRFVYRPKFKGARLGIGIFNGWKAEDFERISSIFHSSLDTDVTVHSIVGASAAYTRRRCMPESRARMRKSMHLIRWK